MSPEDSITLIKANLAEILNPQIIENVILNEKRALKVYWGAATTGRPHCGYFVPMMKIAELLAAGCELTILLADLHAYLDNMKAPMELIEHRAKYYEFVVKSTLKAAGVDISKLKFVKGTSYQTSQNYIMDLFKALGITSVNDAKRAGAEVVKQTDNPMLGGLVYPLMQMLDEEYLEVDAQIGGVDQRKIFVHALETLPRLGYKPRAHLMNPMVPGLGEAAKMSASDADSKIDLLDSPEDVKKKMKKAVCSAKVVEGNGVIAFVEHVILRALVLKDGKDAKIVVDGAELVYTNMEKLKEDYAADTLTPQLLKSTLTKYLNDLLAPIRTDFEASTEWQDIQGKAYPVVEKVKFMKGKKGTKGGERPNAKKGGIETKADGHLEGEGTKKANVSPKTEVFKKIELKGS